MTMGEFNWFGFPLAQHATVTSMNENCVNIVGGLVPLGTRCEGNSQNRTCPECVDCVFLGQTYKSDGKCTEDNVCEHHWGNWESETCLLHGRGHPQKIDPLTTISHRARQEVTGDSRALRPASKRVYGQVIWTTWIGEVIEHRHHLLHKKKMRKVRMSPTPESPKYTQCTTTLQANCQPVPVINQSNNIACDATA